MKKLIFTSILYFLISGCGPEVVDYYYVGCSLVVAKEDCSFNGKHAVIVNVSNEYFGNLPGKPMLFDSATVNGVSYHRLIRIYIDEDFYNEIEVGKTTISSAFDLGAKVPCINTTFPHLTDYIARDGETGESFCQNSTD